MSVLNHLIASTHDDYEVVWDTSVEFDEQKRLVIRLDRSDYSGYDAWGEKTVQTQVACTKAFISFDEACVLSRKLRVSTTNLPAFFFGKFGCENDVEEVQVQDIFKRMLNFVLSKGIHYRLQNK